jgi:phosphinothricin acetyltransferase
VPTPASPRRVTDRDIAAVAEIYAHYVRHSLATFEEQPPGTADWQHKRDELAARRLPFLVAEDGGRVTAFGYASPWRDRPSYRYTAEDTVYVAPDATGRGLGRLVLEALVDECAGAGIRQLLAVIADTGLPASVALHRACGFTEAGRLRGVGYKHGRWIDTVIMQRALDRGERPAGGR